MSGPRIMVEIKGQAVPLSECDWIMYRPCGCTCGVLLAYMHEEGAPIYSEELAWKDWEPKKRDRDKRKAAGYRLELVTHKDYVARICPTFLNTCDKCKKPAQKQLAMDATA